MRPASAAGGLRGVGLEICAACLRQKAAANPSEHVARSGGGKPRIAGGVDGGNLAGAGDDAAAAFQDHHAGKCVGQALRSFQAVCLHLSSGQAEQASRFQWVRRENRGLSFGCSGFEQGLQPSILRDSVERICIEHEPVAA